MTLPRICFFYISLFFFQCTQWFYNPSLIFSCNWKTQLIFCQIVPCYCIYLENDPWNTNNSAFQPGYTFLKLCDHSSTVVPCLGYSWGQIHGFIISNHLIKQPHLWISLDIGVFPGSDKQVWSSPGIAPFSIISGCLAISLLHQTLLFNSLTLAMGKWGISQATPISHGWPLFHSTKTTYIVKHFF